MDNIDYKEFKDKDGIPHQVQLEKGESRVLLDLINKAVTLIGDDIFAVRLAVLLKL